MSAVSARTLAPSGPPARRRTQEERREATRRTLCDAAVTLLAEVGYERLTTLAIAQRAGVSKGAQAYHYPSKDDMLVAAFEHLLAGWRARREGFIREHGTSATMSQVLRYLWRDVFGRGDYLASVEMMLAARHHPALRARLQAVLASWTLARDDVFRQLLPIDDRDERFAAFLQLNLSVLRGLALFRGLDADEALTERTLQMWIDIATGFVASHRRPEPVPAPLTTRRRKS